MPRFGLTDDELYRALELPAAVETRRAGKYTSSYIHMHVYEYDDVMASTTGPDLKEEVKYTAYSSPYARTIGCNRNRRYLL
jgi:hypothetical protein